MGKYFQLFGMVETKDMSDEFAKMTPQKRQDEIERLANSPNLIGVYSPQAFHVNFRGEIVEIKAGWNQYSAGFAVWALQKYGRGSKYGKTYSSAADGKLVENPELLDEPPGGEEKKVRKTEDKA